MTHTLPAAGGSYIRATDGTLKPAGAPEVPAATPKPAPKPAPKKEA
jgi:hypothetical protein